MPEFVVVETITYRVRASTAEQATRAVVDGAVAPYSQDVHAERESTVEEARE